MLFFLNQVCQLGLPYRRRCNWSTHTCWLRRRKPCSAVIFWLLKHFRNFRIYFSRGKPGSHVHTYPDKCPSTSKFWKPLDLYRTVQEICIRTTGSFIRYNKILAEQNAPRNRMPKEVHTQLALKNLRVGDGSHMHPKFSVLRSLLIDNVIKSKNPKCFRMVVMSRLLKKLHWRRDFSWSIELSSGRRHCFCNIQTLHVYLLTEEGLHFYPGANLRMGILLCNISSDFRTWHWYSFLVDRRSLGEREVHLCNFWRHILKNHPPWCLICLIMDLVGASAITPDRATAHTFVACPGEMPRFRIALYSLGDSVPNVGWIWNFTPKSGHECLLN